MKQDKGLEVYKHNKAVSLKLSNIKTPLQFLIYSLVIAKIDNSLKLENIKDEDLIMKITHNEILEQLEIKRIKPTFKKEIQDLSTLQIEHIDKENIEEFIFINVFLSISYQKYILTAKINKEIIDYFIEFNNGNFLSYKFKTLIKFKSKYTMLLYDLIKSDYYLLKKKYHFEYDLSFLLDKLQVNAKSMRVYQNFKVKILEKAIKEINTHTNLNIKYKAIKNVYTVVKIRFLPLGKKKIENKKDTIIGNTEIDYKTLYEKEQKRNKILEVKNKIVNKKFHKIYDNEEEQYLQEIGEN